MGAEQLAGRWHDPGRPEAAPRSGGASAAVHGANDDLDPERRWRRGIERQDGHLHVLVRDVPVEGAGRCAAELRQDVGVEARCNGVGDHGTERIGEQADQGKSGGVFGRDRDREHREVDELVAVDG
ncbi:MAG TPA: hypothetical protein VLG28_15170 [Acidimicrobiia bacterium]|nr:hypothetical protein [Acidimicrobiia bacterium]